MSSDDLRFILILIGAAIVLAVYLSGRFRRKNKEFPEEVDFEQPIDLSVNKQIDRPEIIPTGFTAKDKVEPIPPILETRVDELRSQRSETKEAKQAATEERERILSLHVQFDRHGGVNGNDLLQSLNLSGLQAGEMDIFHAYEEGSQSMPLYSVANMVNPGTLKPEELPGMKVPGITFFACLPGPRPSEKIFQLMLEAARSVAGRLHGTLYNQARQPLTESEIERIKGELASPQS